VNDSTKMISESRDDAHQEFHSSEFLAVHDVRSKKERVRGCYLQWIFTVLWPAFSPLLKWTVQDFVRSSSRFDSVTSSYSP
jgi:hypothetical protein